MKEHHCKFCSHLLFKGDCVGGLEIKCPRCKQFNSITYFSQTYLTESKLLSKIIASNI